MTEQWESLFKHIYIYLSGLLYRNMIWVRADEFSSFFFICGYLDVILMIKQLKIRENLSIFKQVP